VGGDGVGLRGEQAPDRVVQRVDARGGVELFGQRVRALVALVEPIEAQPYPVQAEQIEEADALGLADPDARGGRAASRRSASATSSFYPPIGREVQALPDDAP
jgi:hypothetical protein